MQVVNGMFDAVFFKQIKKTNIYKGEKNKNSIYVASVIKDIDVIICSSVRGKKHIEIRDETINEIVGTFE